MSPARTRNGRLNIAPSDASALLGGVLWLALVLAGDLDAIDRALALAPLVLVPLGIGMAATPPFPGFAGRLHGLAVTAQPVGAALFVASLVAPVNGPTAALLASPWVLVTGLLGALALVRVRKRGATSVPENLVDAGLAYSVVGAVALVLFHLGLTFWFDPTIVRLTAVHFHYAGFALPLVTGLVGRSLETESSLYDTAAVVVLVGPGLIALGISFSPVIEVLAVGAFTLAVTLLAGFVTVQVAPTRQRPQGALLALSSLALPVSMALALGYAVSVYAGADVLGLRILTMVRIHGSLNAFGFALLGLVGWRLAVPEW
ncbi:YndJ family protein [Haloarchaeobius sp. HME9146]|uniref:YndJ family protein n=1 Tax=Haloarchaeobius sp. HME9146 TaxID=2978732 RepID=UPI0021C1F6D4|nr:YndJ family protein [Haloarchaeobius sp. HME9146]MCT9096256.1 YndJ family protein [Haloarchaeobius sp. HME9146]